MVDCTKNLYEILNVSYNASFEEIKAAYKKLVRVYHPDINKTFGAEIKFKLLNNAYEILSDAIKRKNYDSLLNIANSNFKNDTKNEISKTVEYRKETYRKTFKKEDFKKEEIDNNSIIKEIKITEDEANKGTSRTVNILNTQKCPKCMGKKFINGVKCGFCLGEGEKKNFKQIEVKIEKGTQNKDLIYVGKANSSALYDKKLFLRILIEPPKKMYFEGNNITVYVEIPYYEAILGTDKEINIESIGLVDFKIPPLTKPDTKIKLDINEQSANYFAKIKISFPNSITYEEKQLYDKIRLINSRE